MAERGKKSRISFDPESLDRYVQSLSSMGNIIRDLKEKYKVSCPPPRKQEPREIEGEEIAKLSMDEVISRMAECQNEANYLDWQVSVEEGNVESLKYREKVVMASLKQRGMEGDELHPDLLEIRRELIERKNRLRLLEAGRMRWSRVYGMLSRALARLESQNKKFGRSSGAPPRGF